MNKLIFQSAWKLNGEIAGLVETSMVIPSDMKHFDRDANNTSQKEGSICE